MDNSPSMKKLKLKNKETNSNNMSMKFQNIWTIILS